MKLTKRYNGPDDLDVAPKVAVRRPADIFNSCPRCESPNLYKFEGDAFCTYCSWDSVLLRADARFSVRQSTEPATLLRLCDVDMDKESLRRFENESLELNENFDANEEYVA